MTEIVHCGCLLCIEHKLHLLHDAVQFGFDRIRPIAHVAQLLVYFGATN
jgi:hypothetical protein